MLLIILGGFNLLIMRSIRRRKNVTFLRLLLPSETTNKLHPKIISKTTQPLWEIIYFW